MFNIIIKYNIYLEHIDVFKCWVFVSELVQLDVNSEYVTQYSVLFHI